jgi:L-seryl-tRNA(Ser) seleniumtransferase
MSIEEINSMAKELSYEIDNLGFGSKIKVHLEESYSEVGGGSLPLEQLPTICVVLNLDGISTQAFENQLRRYSVPIITRLYKDKIYMDMRTLKREEFTIILEGIKFAVENLEECSI